MPVEYRILGKDNVSGSGYTRDLSSGGIAFETGEDLPAGCQVEVAVQWPIPLQGGTPLKLVLRGAVLRSVGRLAAVRVHKCQFHTQRRARAAGDCLYV